MLHLIASNRFEVLLDALHQQLDADPPASPLGFQRVIVPSLAVRRAITLHTAQRYGICINLEFAFLAQWLWSMIGRVVPGIAAQTPFDAQVLSWRIDQQFGESSALASHARLGPYLAASDDAMRFALAQRTATLFEQYTTYRPDWLDAWNRNAPVATPSGDAARMAIWAQDEAWQRNLWRAITTQLQAASDNPVARFVARLQRDPAAAKRVLPPQVHVVALPTIAPQHWTLLRALALVIDVHVYALNPSREYWFDIVSEKRRLRLQASGHALHTDVGHPILAAWGRQTQAHWATLYQQLDDTQDVDARFVEPTGSHRLARLQRAILNLDASVHDAADGPANPRDPSIEVHVCHSLRRELEALQNRLLVLFAMPDAPTPDQILVVMPSLDDAAPMIDAVFGASATARHVAYTITGRSQGLDGNVADSLMALIDLGGSRVKASGLMQWLEMPLVMQRLGWSSDEVHTAGEWLQSAGMRWGLHADHRGDFDVPADAAHTFDDALDRLVLGHMMPSDRRGQHRDVPTIDVQGSGDGTGHRRAFLGKWPVGHATGQRAEILGMLAEVALRLNAWRQSLATPKTPAAWHGALLTAMHDFFLPASTAEVEGLRALRSALSQWQCNTDAADFHRVVTAPVMRAAVQTLLAARAQGGAPSGSLTFASMSSLRNLPYRVIAAVGLNGGAFPSPSLNLEFDLTSQTPRLGDRQPKQDDRNVMLDALLAARDALWLSYTGRDIRSNAELPPSVLVSELIDALAQAEGVDAATMSGWITTNHPLQPFAAELFARNAPAQRRSHHSAYAKALMAASAARGRTDVAPPLAAASRLQVIDDDADAFDQEDDGDGNDDDADDARSDAQQAPFLSQPLPPPSAALRTVGLHDLKAFFANPARHLLTRRLGIRLPRANEAPLDDEPFELDRRERTAMVANLMPLALQGGDASSLIERARCGTSFPSGSLGERILRHEVHGVQRQAGVVRAGLARSTPVEPLSQHTLDVDVDGQTWQLTLQLHDVRSDGLHRWGPSKLRAKDRLAAWLDHLALNVLAPSATTNITRWVARDIALAMAPLRNAACARTLLTDWVNAYARGMSQPLAFMPLTSWVAALDAAPSVLANAWSGKTMGESLDPYVQLAWRGRPPLIQHATFLALAQDLLRPLNEALTEEGL